MSPTLTVDVCIDAAERRRALEAEVRMGLSSTPKQLSPVWFYDEVGSRLFDDITRLPEYYPTRTEHRLLVDHAAEIIGIAGPDTLVELGSGTSDKTRTLLDAMTSAGRLDRFVPVDVSEEVLRQAAARIGQDYGTDVHAVVGDFLAHLHRIPVGGRRLVAFLGSTIGNLHPEARRRFLFDLEASMGHQDSFLLGTDLVKDEDRLVAAYDDAAGVTAAFNRNVLAVLNAELGADFDPASFAHVACWDGERSWIEMRLRSRHAQVVHLTHLDLDVTFDRGEELRTETSAKFRADELHAELTEVGFLVDKSWTDPAGDYLLTLAHPYC